jgi:hypothetical protein
VLVHAHQLCVHDALMKATVQKMYFSVPIYVLSHSLTLNIVTCISDYRRGLDW